MTCIINFYKIVNTKKYQAHRSPNKKLKYKKISGPYTNLQCIELSIYSKSNSILGFQITRPNLNKPLMKKANKMYKYDSPLSFNLTLSLTIN